MYISQDFITFVWLMVLVIGFFWTVLMAIAEREFLWVFVWLAILIGWLHMLAG